MSHIPVIGSPAPVTLPTEKMPRRNNQWATGRNNPPSLQPHVHFQAPVPNAQWDESYAYAPYGQHYHHNGIRPSYWNSAPWHGEDNWRQPGPSRRQHAHPYAYHNALHEITYPPQPDYALPADLNDYNEKNVPGPIRHQREVQLRAKAAERVERAIPEKLRVNSDVSARKITVRWSMSGLKTNVHYLITVTCIAVGNGASEDNIGRSWNFEQPWTQTQRELKTTPGNTYTIRIECRDNADPNILIASANADIKACFDMAEHEALYAKAVAFAGTNMHPFDYLYRCKPKVYWDYIHHSGNGIMQKYLKDNNGQPANKINASISGLFFSARLLHDGTLPTSSPFGDIRMMVHSNVLLDPMKYNFYFSDFYCNYLTHYVTIVVCLKRSETDRYCEDKLYRMNIETNPFLKVIYEGMNPYAPYRCWVNRNVWVEIYYTEDIPLNWGKFNVINATGAGTSKIGGLPNNKECEKCNLYPLKKEKPAPVVVTTEEGAEIQPKPTEDPDDLDYNDALDLTVHEELQNSTLTVLLGETCSGFEEHWDDVVEAICGLVDSVCEAEEEETEEGGEEEEENGDSEAVYLSVEEALAAAQAAIPDHDDEYMKAVEELQDFAANMTKHLGEIGERVSSAERRRLHQLPPLPPSPSDSPLKPPCGSGGNDKMPEFDDFYLKNDDGVGILTENPLNSSAV